MPQLPYCTDHEGMALDKSMVDALNSARVLTDTLVRAAPSGRFQLPNEHYQLAAFTKKIFDLPKCLLPSTPLVVNGTFDKKDASVSSRPSYNFLLTSKYLFLASWQ